MARRKKRFQLLTALYTSIGMLFFWWPILLNPHNYLFSQKTEGLIHYFKHLYYILLDSNLHFSGMHHPFGESILRSGHQTWFTLGLHYLMNGNTDYAANIIAILNLLMIAAIPVGAVYLFRIFHRWGMPNYYSALAASAIALMSPQVHQISDGHFALSYVCFFPMLWYYTLNWLQNRQFSSILWLLVTIVLFAGLDNHYLCLGIFWLLAVALMSYWVKRKSRKAALQSVLLMVAAILPVLLWILLDNVLFPDTIADRHQDALDLVNRSAPPLSLMIPGHGIVHELISTFFWLPDYPSELSSFVGTAAILSILGGLSAVRFWLKHDGRPPIFAGVFLFAALFAWLASIGILHFANPSVLLPKALWSSGGIFTLGWISYYVFAAAAAWLLYILADTLRRTGQPIVSTALVAVILALWFYEGMNAHKKLTTDIKSTEGQTLDLLAMDHSVRHLLDSQLISSNNFQAVLALPYFHKGSNIIRMESDYATAFNACKTALELNLPLLHTCLPQPSVGQSLNIAAITGHPLIEKTLIRDIEDKRPILLLSKESKADNALNHWLIEEANIIGSSGGFNFYELPIENMLKARTEALNTFNLSDFRFRELIHGDTIQTQTRLAVVWKRFDTSEKTNSILWQGNANYWRGEEISLSVWLEWSLEKALNARIEIEQLNENDELISTQSFRADHTTDIRDTLLRVELTLKVPEETKSFSVHLRGKGGIAQSLLITKAGANVWIATDRGERYFNHYPLDNR